MLHETIIHEKRHAHEMERRLARRNRRTAYGSQPHYRGHGKVEADFNQTAFMPGIQPVMGKPGFFSRVMSWLAGNKGRR